MNSLTYLVYIIWWEIFTLGGGAYIVFWKGGSAFWMLLAVFLSGSAYRPTTWRVLK